MSLLFAVALAATQTAYYQAKVTTFGCNSIAEVSQLENIRSDRKAFQMALLQQEAYGQCITIPAGTVVAGSIETARQAILRVNMQVDPPGYEAPLSDFELKS